MQLNRMQPRIKTFFISVLLFIGVLSILAGVTTAALADADVDGGRHRGRLDLFKTEKDPFVGPLPRACQAPPADDLSVLLESTAGTGPVRNMLIRDISCVIK